MNLFEAFRQQSGQSKYVEGTGLALPFPAVSKK
jgi:hypothetical protein